MQATLSAPTVDQQFPAGTVDPGYTFTVTGTLEDGTAFSASTANQLPSATFDLQPGTYTGTVSKLGVTSLPSAPLVVTVPTTVTLTVPDPAQAALLA